MKAVGYYKPLPLTDPMSLVDAEFPCPVASGRDLLVRVRAVSVNPVDIKTRKSRAGDENILKVLGYDAAGVVEEAGELVTLFSPGDEVYYAGEHLRQGTNAEYHLVDERIAGTKPENLSFEQAAGTHLRN